MAELETSSGYRCPLCGFPASYTPHGPRGCWGKPSDARRLEKPAQTTSATPSTPHPWAEPLSTWRPEVGAFVIVRQLGAGEVREIAGDDEFGCNMATVEMAQPGRVQGRLTLALTDDLVPLPAECWYCGAPPTRADLTGRGICEPCRGSAALRGYSAR